MLRAVRFDAYPFECPVRLVGGNGRARGLFVTWNGYFDGREGAEGGQVAAGFDGLQLFFDFALSHFEIFDDVHKVLASRL